MEPVDSSKHSNNDSCGGCPVQHSKPTTGCPVQHHTPSQQPQSQASSQSCPVAHKDAYTAYGEKLNPTNQMPPPIQHPWPGQKVTIPVDRQTSNIPKGGTANTWVFPSPQMFYNALQRKNKSEGVTEQDVETMVYVHNTMNENTWNLVKHWESLHKDECADPRLLWFVGKPDELSPRGYFWSLFGHKPFDRHDWVVDRCGKQVKYIIDFYSRKTDATDSSPFPKSSLIADVRPALNSFENAYDRVRYFWANLFGNKLNEEKFTYQQPSPTPAPKDKIVDRDYSVEKRSYPVAMATLQKIHQRCQKLAAQLSPEATPEEREYHESKLQLCVGNVVCPNEVETFVNNLQESAPQPQIDSSYSRAMKCVDSFNVWLRESIESGPPSNSSYVGAAPSTPNK